MAQEAVGEALSYLNPREIRNKQYPVLLRRDAAASLIGAFSPVFSAENAQQGMSLLNDKVGEKIAASNITLIDDPLKADGMASRTFDAEGVASRRMAIVENGQLNTLFHNQKTAKKAGVETTGHAHKQSYKGAITVSPSNFYVKPGEQSYDEIVKGIEEGVVITGLSGLHSGVNQISGDFSLEAKGYVVKNGAIDTATNQLTIAGNFFELLNQVEAVGSDLEFPFGSIGSPSLLVQQLSVTSE